MAINKIPPEILSLIFHEVKFLSPHTQYYGYDDDEQTLSHLKAARLVCRQWNLLATKHLFRSIALLHANPDADGYDANEGKFAKWNSMADSATVRRSCRAVEVYSGPHHRSCPNMDMRDDGTGGRFPEDWKRWENDEWTEFKTAIARVGTDLPNLEEVQILFSARCEGIGGPNRWDYDGDVESWKTRRNLLRNVFRAIEEHNRRFGGGGGGGGNDDYDDDDDADDHDNDHDKSARGENITRLEIQNLANQPLWKTFTKEVEQDFFGTGGCGEGWIKDIKKLELSIAVEYNESAQDRNLQYVERRTFEPWLQTEFLPRFGMDTLTELRLSFDEPWGVAPGTFDGKGLNFRNLKNLYLGGFVIGHHDHFDWVLRQTSLERLVLRDCPIVAWIVVTDKEVHEWGIRTHDWKKDTSGQFGKSTPAYTFDGTWEMVFDRIRMELDGLVDFRMIEWRDPATISDPDDEEAGPWIERYIMFHVESIPAWCEGPEDRADETKEADERAFLELLNVVRKRRLKSRR